MKIPNFYILGAAKAATTSIHEYLNQHPSVFMSDFKEPCYHILEDNNEKYFKGARKVKFVNNLLDYKNLFRKANQDHLIIGESSTPYLLYSDTVIKSLKKHHENYNDLKFLIVLRNPIKRAFSQYLMRVRDLEEKLDFISSLEIEKKRIEDGFHFDSFYIEKGKYYASTRRYLSEFSNVKIMFFEDFVNDSNSFLQEICEFLKIESFSFKSIDKKNKSGISKHKFLVSILKDDFLIKRLLKKVIHKKYLSHVRSFILDFNLKKNKPKITVKEFNFALNLLTEDIEKLEKLLNKDLSHWKRYE